ncbi:hypothetical protein GE21DRAFT_7453 [Neurospora crassa]|uniref:Uncharacterized protein n=1 Tax=Neurospora crassa (strain ATCC 24698 / 74-OR23-1A / CBS 708.71 / DSM 1257 / FGSC 987) TaxID=367110 RepID=V5IP10_NEUCR|nr:uncharacterized protein NCU01034 [Neurospora crassa OR74A]XP_011394456.1 hypothetical protein NCU01034 [Neurospora crassa OR74A]pir/T48706/ hypothetical protein 1A9.100 [imported] - Neurospora crassa [Neurospora crassa]ESA42485.1 hypothetical protein NCU01034 [Neurospora crassa OR74A]ESA42486.1 hypothetical protein, variant [Neurospora crassa OR74A]KHE88352.1 hypothetical protein GE21DRAFT_7453 [Neurospora crassa]|eukprot:XP_011394455.1 uncharacterized protein NCU01034 [Neurospora crassa OR74A]
MTFSEMPQDSSTLPKFISWVCWVDPTRTDTPKMHESQKVISHSPISPPILSSQSTLHPLKPSPSTDLHADQTLVSARAVGVQDVSSLCLFSAEQVSPPLD